MFFRLFPLLVVVPSLRALPSRRIPAPCAGAPSSCRAPQTAAVFLLLPCPLPPASLAGPSPCRGKSGDRPRFLLSLFFIYDGCPPRVWMPPAGGAALRAHVRLLFVVPALVDCVRAPRRAFSFAIFALDC